MGEISFTARQVSETELREIMFAGFTFEAISSGRMPFVPAETGFDKVLSDQGISFASTKTQTSGLNYDLEVEGILIRAATQNFITPLVVPTLTPIAVSPQPVGTVMNLQGTR